MNIKCAGVILNPVKEGAAEISRQLIGILRRYGCKIFVEDELANFDANIDILFVLGGDGTILSALPYSLPNDVPILGINMGRIGFLTEIEPKNLERDISKLFRGEFSFEDRMMMTSEKGEFALNEIVISRRKALDGVLSLEICVGNSHVDSISGDGLIIATSTGSTAYSLSAGGPIVAPGLDCFVITPVCPHTMNARCVVASADEVITVRVLDDRQKACAVFDGRRVRDIEGENPKITIKRSEKSAHFIRLNDKSYFDLLRTKLSEWTH